MPNMPSYIQNNLIANEQVLFTTTHHWIMFFSLQSLCTLFMYPIFKRWTDEFGITNRRVIVKTGLIARDTIEMNLSKIESVNVDQSVLGRILGFGNIIIIGTGGTREVFERIANPIQFKKCFQEMG
jgi:uncharacterized membrane protein YdbT with pleckstrin-like domain